MACSEGQRSTPDHVRANAVRAESALTPRRCGSNLKRLPHSLVLDGKYAPVDQISLELRWWAPAPARTDAPGDDRRSDRVIRSAQSLVKRKSDVDAAKREADRIGYPLLLKASAGGGGRGMRVVNEPTELESRLAAAGAEAEAAFSDSRLYNAQDPECGFLPTPGRLTRWSPPSEGPDVRVDTFVREGQVVTPYYDSMLAKLIVRGDSRAEALARSAAALDAFEVEGVSTTIGLQRAMTDHRDFIEGRGHTRWIEERLADTIP